MILVRNEGIGRASYSRCCVAVGVVFGVVGCVGWGQGRGMTAMGLGLVIIVLFLRDLAIHHGGRASQPIIPHFTKNKLTRA